VNQDDMIPVTLSAQQWNAVMFWLGKQAYESVAPFIQNIQSQCVQYEMGGIEKRQANKVPDVSE
jgi:hypothetical protein